MYFGKNLQFLRKMRNGMTQEELAEKLCVSRQTVSKWELGSIYPEMGKIVELCELFNCTMDRLIREDMTASDKAYSNIRIEWTEPFRYLRYTVISPEPEDDAIGYVRRQAEALGVAPRIIGWDFPFVSQEQINVYHLHGYTAALILPDGIAPEGEICSQGKQKYAAITVRGCNEDPFRIIPGGYKMLMTYMKTNGIRHLQDPSVIGCFEKEYMDGGVPCMDIFIAAE